VGVKRKKKSGEAAMKERTEVMENQRRAGTEEEVSKGGKDGQRKQ